jgi:hypothetical protein
MTGTTNMPHIEKQEQQRPLQREPNGRYMSAWHGVIASSKSHSEALVTYHVNTIPLSGALRQSSCNDGKCKCCARYSMHCRHDHCQSGNGRRALTEMTVKLQINPDRIVKIMDSS